MCLLCCLMTPPNINININSAVNIESQELHIMIFLCFELDGEEEVDADLEALIAKELEDL